MKTRAVVIGGGLGGLTAAIYLADCGFEVSLFEKNSHCGGKANQFFREGFRFDTGPSIFTMDFVLRDLFSFLNIPIQNKLKLLKLDTICKYYFTDGSVLNAVSDIDRFAENLSSITKDSSIDLKNYLNYSKRIYDLTSELFLFKSFKNLNTLFSRKAFNTLLNIKKIDPFRTVHEANSSFFSDKKSIQLFDRYATYNGSNPYYAPATLNIIPFVEIGMGAVIPDGGIFSISKVLTETALDLGVKIFTDTEVEKILIEKERVCGIKVNGIDEKYDIVVCNSDVNYTYSKLLKGYDSKEGRRYMKLTPSSSALVFYWGIKDYISPLETHNIIFSNEYENEFNDLFENCVVPSDPTVYIYISSKLIKKDAPTDCENWFVMVNAPYINGQNWLEETEKARNMVLRKMKERLGVDLNKHIFFEEVLSPIDIEKTTNSHLGSLYGISSNNRNAAFLRQNNKSGSFKNLYFCGGSAHPGGGIPLVMLSGKIAVDLIKRDFNIKSKHPNKI